MLMPEMPWFLGLGFVFLVEMERVTGVNIPEPERLSVCDAEGLGEILGSLDQCLLIFVHGGLGSNHS